jgi:hypothetical protein
MDPVAVFRNEESQERCATVVDVVDYESRRTTRKIPSITFGPLQQTLLCHYAVALGGMKDGIVFLKSLNKPPGCTVVLPAASRQPPASRLS